MGAMTVPGITAAQRQLHEKRRSIHIPHTSGQRAADTVASAVGSWRFIIIQSVIVSIWVIINAIGFLSQWDPYPFILLNLLFSTQAAYTAPIIMMSQNRQAEKDRLRDDHEAEEVDLLYQINQQQLEILHILRTQICPEEDIAASAAIGADGTAGTTGTAKSATPGA